MKLRPAKPISVALIAAAGLILSCAVLALVLVLASRPDPQKTPSSSLRNPLDGIENGVSSLFRGDFSGDEYFAANYFPTLLGSDQEMSEEGWNAVADLVLSLLDIEVAKGAATKVQVLPKSKKTKLPVKLELTTDDIFADFFKQMGL